ncbi:alpha,alpha-trehalose-phosphate synthase (UDP-forming) [Nocardioides marmotae]|uniref:Trehalose-6-phosphate synthase n=1 Tax=Nocardioides marmotae TaxID=2663857 RepID=A0A6I3JCV6_9ACTN|nr:trehalose-6-phosphate synthase [Nocardioides marmotae]MCR6032274.1 trehalose-6-phosphate synthase [Gordonia jinghuaiqii]MBC9734849.1 trehalose-6-phosphate synthase [Nocardioides marmotae]MTB85950.1 trehalose-6-phosphate synthase [Nocardioides marmotae]MTB95922.1 trehalose-6-phosphate synthase [Nocardioides marmotae]QKE02738.1 trehalose-6-phosphate synthase [Nocardioides marmotae]
MSTVSADLVIVANRLPVDRVEQPDGTMGWRTSPGGLVTAIEPVMRANDGTWIGWPGGTDEDLEPFEADGMKLVPMSMTQAEIEGHYEGFSNATLWPLYHDLVAKPEFHREWWDSYVSVNRRFAEKAAELASEGATVWVHDYQMQLVPLMLRELRPDLRIGFYLHIPFPPAELFQQLPWRRQLLEGLLGADMIGFQLPGGAQNFVRLVRQRVGHKTHRDLVYLPDGRTVRAAAFPISIDAAGFEAMARSEPVAARAAEIREALGNPRKVFLGIDRLDYTKGIYARLRAFSELIADGHLDVEDAVFVQVAVPSREQVEQYRILRDDIDRLVGRVNGDLGRIGRPAISYLHSSYPREEMAALYRAADVMVVTPYRDGMNLVAKEYVACRLEDTGALVLSEFAGAANELRQAWLVNPYDINGMKSALLDAYSADDRETRRRMKAMRRTVAQNDVAAWADAFMSELAEVPGSHGKAVRPAKRS